MEFFKVPNALMDDGLICGLTGVELKIYLLIVRKTIGWHQEKEAISIKEFCEILKISNRHVIKGCNYLAEKGLIKAIKKDKKTTIFSISYYDQKSQDEPAKLMTKSHKILNKRSQDVSIYKDTNKDTIQKERFKTPKIAEIEAYINEHNFNIDSLKFFDYYESIGWKIGKNPMKDWRATIRNWNRNNKKTNKADDVVERFFI
jgi:phage replication O-like protein O